jgi:hypothetical protein
MLPFMAATESLASPSLLNAVERFVVIPQPLLTISTRHAACASSGAGVHL